MTCFPDPCAGPVPVRSVTTLSGEEVPAGEFRSSPAAKRSDPARAIPSAVKQSTQRKRKEKPLRCLASQTPPRPPAQPPPEFDIPSIQPTRRAWPRPKGMTACQCLQPGSCPGSVPARKNTPPPPSSTRAVAALPVLADVPVCCGSCGSNPKRSAPPGRAPAPDGGVVWRPGLQRSALVQAALAAALALVIEIDRG